MASSPRTALLPSRHGCAAPGPQRQNPGACRHSAPFRLRRNRAGRSSAPPFGFAAQNRARRFAARNDTVRFVRFAAMASPPRTDVLAYPAFALLKRGPPAKTPALAPIRSHFACGETARPVVAPAGGNVLATPFSLRSNVAPHIPAGSAGVRSFVPRLAPRSHPGACSRSVAFRSAKPRGRSSAPPGPMFCRPRHGCAAPGPQRQNPGPPRFQSGFFCAKTGGRVPPLSDGGALTKSENIILCASSCHPPRSPYPHCTLPRVRFSGIGQKKKPQRKTAAAVNTLYMSCKKTSVNPISFPVALCTKISPFKAIHLLSQCKTKIQFLWMRMRKRSAN